MSGQPRTRAAMDAVHAAFSEHADEGQSPLDFVLEHIEAGGTLVTLAREINAARSTVYRYLKRNYGEDLANRLRDARREGAQGLVDAADEILTDANTASREELQKAKWRSDLALWRAERADPTLGKAAASVNINLGELHVLAMKSRAVHAAATATLSAPTEIAEAEVIESPAA